MKFKLCIWGKNRNSVSSGHHIRRHMTYLITGDLKCQLANICCKNLNLVKKWKSIKTYKGYVVFQSYFLKYLSIYIDGLLKYWIPSPLPLPIAPSPFRASPGFPLKYCKCTCPCALWRVWGKRGTRPAGKNKLLTQPSYEIFGILHKVWIH